MREPDHSKLNSSLKLMILSLLGASLMVGCGVRGNLKTPPPVFGGDDAKVDSSQIPNEDLDTDENEDDLILLGDDLDLLDDQ